MDPDYQLPENIVEEANKRREKEKSMQIEKIQQQINELFKTELENRESQLMDIQNRVTCLAKTLHVLRYVLVSNYYNDPKAQLEFAADEAKMIDAQARLHPAVKKIINEQDLANLDFSARRTRRPTKRINVVPINENLVQKQPEKQVEQSEANVSTVDISINIPRNRQMSKRQIIIGNISKWMPSENSEDSSTHKWMVYVRGPQENPRVDDFIKKIVFHLHPSYHPHDVIELTENPFHLVRRGWGEFPIRCELHFVSPLNKPVNVIHELKLDKTFSGRQTLGSETIVQLTLYDENQMNYESTSEEEFYTEEENNVMEEEQESGFEVKIEPSTSDFYDYINDMESPQIDDQDIDSSCVLFDHNYSIKHEESS